MRVLCSLISIIYVLEFCSSVIIDENQLSSAHIISNTTTFEQNKEKTPPQQKTKMAFVHSSFLSQHSVTSKN